MLFTCPPEFTIIVKLVELPKHDMLPLVKVGVTVIMPLIGTLVVLVAVKDGMFVTLPPLLAAKPMAVLLFVHVYVVVPPVLLVPNVTKLVPPPLQTV